MRKNKTPGGSIVATASAAAVTPHETYPEYDGAKAAVSMRQHGREVLYTDGTLVLQVMNFVRATSRVLKIVGGTPFF